MVGVGRTRRRPGRLDRRRSTRFDRDAPERHGRRGDRPLVLRPEAAPQPHRLRGGPLPIGALRAAGVVAFRRRGRRLQGRRRGDRGDRRAHAARPGFPRALQDGRDPARRADRRACARRRRVCLSRRLPVGGRGAARRDRARDRVLRRRLGQVAVRRARRGLAVRPPRPRRAALARVRGLAGSRQAVRVRDGDDSRRPVPRAS